MKIPYAHNDGNLKKFLTEKLPEANIPQKVNKKYFETLGYTSSNDRPIIGVLKFLGIIDSSGNPTQVYRDLRDSTKAKKVLGEQIRKSYAELYGLYPDAHNRDDEAIANVLRSNSDASKATIAMTVRTFKTLCTLADFSNENYEASTTNSIPDDNHIPSISKRINTGLSGDSAIVLNVNIQLTLPETTNYEIYDKLFESLRKNLLDRKE